MRALLLVLASASAASSPPREESNATAPRVVFKSMIRTGSRSAHARIDAALGAGNYDYVGEPFPLVRGANSFVIAGARAPCDWLLSAWTWASSGRGAVFRRCSERDDARRPTWAPLFPTDGDLRSAEAVETFRAWVMAHPGLMTRWYADALAPPRDSEAFDFDFCAWRDDDGSRAARLDAAFADGGPVDCWVRTPSLDADLDRCLEAAAARGVVVDADNRRRSGAVYDRDARDGAPRYALRNQGGSSNASPPRAACATYFDVKLLAFVEESERAVIEALGFGSGDCCARAAGDHREL